MLRLFTLLLMLGLAHGAGAESVEKVMMPGPVIQGHAKWEDNCQKCHKPFDKAAQNQLCQDCHKEIGADVTQKQGFHGRMKEQRNCAVCHTEHKGRHARIAPLDEKTFKHADTDFELKGAHLDTKVQCKDCHKSKVKYRETPNKCNDCHKDDDKHKGSLGVACGDCHNEKEWKDTQQFDHNKSRFGLEGKHADVKCADCHSANVKYRDTPRDCSSCHKKDDKHKGIFATKCENCHNAKGWAEETFDHDRDTKYPLRGKHEKVKCESCHTTPIIKTKLDTQCVNCHRKDDKHNGSLGDRCEKCHGEAGWNVTPGFNHDKDTKFPLLGKHKSAKCETCHKGGIQEKLPLLCHECHQADDKHKGNFGTKCETCHMERDWKVTSKFNHDKDTKFALLDKHKSVKCDACHKGKLYEEQLQTTCYACHKKDDKHKGQQGERCEDCHNAKSWKETTKFDHNKSRFPLLGKHHKVECKQCHLTATFKDADTACVSCHLKQDAHKLKLGTQCESCHNARDWKIWDFDHDRRTNFKLTGGHAGIGCYDCHKTPSKSKKLATPTACADCHAKDDVHDGGFGRQCERCHVSTSFKEIKMGKDRVR